MGADDLGTLPGQKRRGTMGHIFRATRPGHDAPPRLETVTPRAFGYRLGANACTVPAFSVLESHRSPPKSFPPFNHLQPLCPRIANRRFHNRIGRLELRFRIVPESPIQIYACHGAARLSNPKIPPRTPFPAAAEVSQRDNVTPKSPPNSPSTHSPHPNCVQWGRPSACGGLSGRPDRLSTTYGGFLTVRGSSRTRFFLRAPPKVVGFSPEALS